MHEYRLIGPLHQHRNHTYQTTKNEKSMIEIKINGALIKLTSREAQCLYYLWHGKSAKQIGNLIFRSSRTVETHIENLRNKTNTRNKFELARQTDSSEINALAHFFKQVTG